MLDGGNLLVALSHREGCYTAQTMSSSSQVTRNAWILVTAEFLAERFQLSPCIRCTTKGANVFAETEQLAILIFYMIISEKKTRKKIRMVHICDLFWVDVLASPSLQWWVWAAITGSTCNRFQIVSSLFQSDYTGSTGHSSNIDQAISIESIDRSNISSNRL